MAVRPPIAIDGVPIAGTDERIAAGALFTPASPLRPRSGSLGGPVLVTAQPTPNMTLSVPSFAAVIDGAGFGVGAVTLVNAGPVTVTVTAASSTNPRIDLVVARWTDNPGGGTSFTPADISVIPGTPAAVPSRPAVPANALVLADVAVGRAVGSVAQSAVTNRLTQTSTVGGITPSRDQNDVVGIFQGQYRHRLDTGQLEVFTGTIWILQHNFGVLGVLGTPLSNNTPPDTLITPYYMVPATLIFENQNATGELQVSFGGASFPNACHMIVASIGDFTGASSGGAWQVRTRQVTKNSAVFQVADRLGNLLLQPNTARISALLTGW